jgi:hypothetical protein
VDHAWPRPVCPSDWVYKVTPMEISKKKKQFLNRILGAHRESLLRSRSSAIASYSTLWKVDHGVHSACSFGGHNGAIRHQESGLHALARRCS